MFDDSPSTGQSDGLPGLDHFRSETTEILCCACGNYAWFNRLSWTVSCPTCRFSLDAETYRAWRDTHVRPIGLAQDFPSELPLTVAVPCPLGRIYLPPADAHDESQEQHLALYMPEQLRWKCTWCDVSGGSDGFGRLLAVAEELAGMRLDLEISAQDEHARGEG